MNILFIGIIVLISAISIRLALIEETTLLHKNKGEMK